jgi:3-hydroxyisobutyrate dehydrogenase-like beta-hydroxyacid dehydrogenase
MSTVAFLGLGAMGSRMATRLLGAGHDLVVWNRTAAKTRDLEAKGASSAHTPAEAVRRADVVVTMVADPDALAAVSEGSDGVAAGSTSDTTVIEMSTVGPAALTRLWSKLPDEAGLLDAPVLGSLGEAESGSLHIFVGGPVAAFERWSPLLSALGTPLHVGELGSGAAAKLVANSTLLGTLGILGEALALADGLGLSRDKAFDVLARTPMSAQAERRRPAVQSGQYPLHFALDLAVKDAELVNTAAESAGVDVRLAAAARSWLRDAAANGLQDADYSAVLSYITGAVR